jgi:hypothetical protein
MSDDTTRAESTAGATDGEAARADDAAARPSRPQYGEYATPEEQRARIRQPDVTRALDTGASATEQPVAAPAFGEANAHLAHAAPSHPARETSVTAAAPPRPRMVDRIVTFALLAYGLVNVVSSFPTFLDYSLYADTMFALLGVDVELADPAAGRPWGIAAALVLAIGWLVTAAFSWWSVRRGRLSWWIPLVGGIVFTLVAGTLMVVPLMNDPAAWEALVGTLP